ncbi:MAG: polyprenyl synthetase family protein [Bilophila wadsworthia]
MSTPYDSQQVKTILAERGAQVEAYLQHCLDAIPMQGRLKEAMYYSLLAGGKRLRPVLCLSTAALFGLSAEAVMPFAASLEMIHTSPHHDDLPRWMMTICAVAAPPATRPSMKPPPSLRATPADDAFRFMAPP